MLITKNLKVVDTLGVDFISHDEDNPIYLKADILALSVAWHRLRGSKANVCIEDFHSQTLLEHITSDDISKADTIRDYYSKKIMIWALHGKELSKFRTSLAEFMLHEKRVFSYKREWVGIAWRLPEFYEYDSVLDGLFQTNFNNEIDNKLLGMPKIATLLPVKKLTRRTQRINNFQYWFSIEKTKQAAVINIQHDNPLLPLWDHIFNMSKPISINAQYRVSTRTGFIAYVLDKWKIVNQVTFK